MRRFVSTNFGRKVHRNKKHVPKWLIINRINMKKHVITFMKQLHHSNKALHWAKLYDFL